MNTFTRTIVSVSLLLVMSLDAAADEITFTFENATVTSDSGGEFFEVDLYVGAAAGSLGPNLALINYNTRAFGSGIASGVTATPGSLIAGNPKYAIILNDNGSSRLAVTIYYDVFEPGGGAPLSPEAQQLVHLKIPIDDASESPGLSFDDELMQGQQYADDLTTVFPAVADDTEDGSSDSDGDGVIDEQDNCPEAANPDQADVDGDGTGDGCDVDDDNDGVADGDDSCPGTRIPESVPTVRLNPNHYALTTADLTFDTVVRGKAPSRAITTTDTRGCSCEQILDALGLGKGQRKHGCPAGIMTEWIGGAGKSGIADIIPLPETVLLEANYPNPFNPQTTIRFALPEGVHVQLIVFDTLGRRVRMLADSAMERGWHEISFDAAGLPSGLYLYRLKTGEMTMQRIMTLLR